MSGCGRIDRGYSKRVADAVTWCYDCPKCYHIELAEYGVATRYQAEEDSIYCATFPCKHLTNLVNSSFSRLTIPRARELSANLPQAR